MKSFLACLAVILCAGTFAQVGTGGGQGCILESPAWSELWKSWPATLEGADPFAKNAQAIIEAQVALHTEIEKLILKQGGGLSELTLDANWALCSSGKDVHAAKSIKRRFPDGVSQWGQTEYPISVMHAGGSATNYYFISFGKDDSVTNLAFLSLNGDKWRGVEYGVYPNGKPHYLSCTEDGRPAGMSRVWDVDGNVYDTVMDGIPLGDARLYPDKGMDTPPSDVAPGVKGKADAATCFVRLSCNGNLLDFPWQCSKSYLKGAQATITPPFISGYEFEKWSGDIAGSDVKALLMMDADKNLVAHYHAIPAFNDQRLSETILEATGKTPDTLTWEDLLKLTDLKAADKGIKEIEGLEICSNLKTLDLSGNRIGYLDSLSSQNKVVRRAREWEQGSEYAPLKDLVCLLCRMPGLDKLETLTINNSQCESIAGTSQLPALREIQANENNIAFLAGLPSSLEVLSLDKNQITEIRGSNLVSAKKLRRLSVRDNRISDLALLMDTDGIAAGLAIDIEGNPIAIEGLAEKLAALEGKGISVKVSQEKAGKEEDWQADPDKDGYTNKDEWRFASLFTADPEEIRREYDKASREPKIPSEYIRIMQTISPSSKPKSVESIPTQYLQITIAGSGMVNPGDGMHTFAKYSIKPDKTWDYNKVTLRAIPSEGWTLDRPNCQTGNFRNKFDDQGNITFSMEEQGFCLAIFKEGSPLKDVDLLSDFEAFLKAKDLSDKPFEYDQNENDHRGNEIVLKPDGIPDAAEIKLLDTLLKTPDLEPVFGFMVKSWKDNLDQIKKDLKDYKDVPGAINTLNAYLTMATGGDLEYAKQMCKKLFGVKICLENYSTVGMGHFGAEGQLSNVSTWAEELWAEVSQGKPRNRELMDAFAKRVIQDAKREY